MAIKGLFLFLCLWATSQALKNYTGHKVFRVIPNTEEDLNVIKGLYADYSVDLWNGPRSLGDNVLMHLTPELIDPVESHLKEKKIEYDVAFHDLQSAIEEERSTLVEGMNSVSDEGFDFGKYHTYEPYVQLIKDLSKQYENLARLETIGKTFEHRPIYNLKISSGDSLEKPVIMMECGIHAREWSSVAAGAYLINKLLTTYGTDATVTSLLDKYEFNIILLANPDGFVYTWREDRLWRKTRSRSRIDFLGICLGVDANRNFDIDHCGVGTSRKPCDEIYCGDKPFSESESRALRDMMISKQNRMAAYFSLHAFSQYWMTPYGIKKNLPDNYEELIRVGKAGVDALAAKYGTKFELGSIANIIYEAAGSSVDYAYEVLGIKIAFALELRDNGRHGFILPKKQIIPMCEETYDGLVGAIQAL